MPRTAQLDRYLDLIKRAEDHYDRQGFVKWSDLASELGVSRQRILQMLQAAIGFGHITSDDLERYRSVASRSKLARQNTEMRRDLERLRIRLTLTPENHEWLVATCGASDNGTTRNDLINTALTHYRNHA